MNKFYVYAHYKPNDTIPFYIGKGSRERAYIVKKRNQHWKNVVKKYGFRVEIMYDNLSEELAFQMEKDFIKMWGRADLGCGPLVNQTDGGDGAKLSEETKKKISDAHKGVPLSESHKRQSGLAKLGIPLSDSHKEQISLGLKGKNVGKSPWNKGKTGVYSDDHLKYLKTVRLGMKHSEETKKKMSKDRKGRSLSEEHKNAIRNGLLAHFNTSKD